MIGIDSLLSQLVTGFIDLESSTLFKRKMKKLTQFVEGIDEADWDYTVYKTPAELTKFDVVCVRELGSAVETAWNCGLDNSVVLKQPYKIAPGKVVFEDLEPAIATAEEEKETPFGWLVVFDLKKVPQPPQTPPPNLFEQVRLIQKEKEEDLRGFEDRKKIATESVADKLSQKVPFLETCWDLLKIPGKM